MPFALPRGMWRSATFLRVPLCTLLLGVGAPLTHGCGPLEEDPDARLLPLLPGARWEYRVSDRNGRPGARTVRVVGREGEAMIVETRENGVSLMAWLQVDEMVLALKEEQGGDMKVFHPGALRALPSARLKQGQVIEHSWHEDPMDTLVTASWTVEGRETIQVDAGRFDTIRFRRSQSNAEDARLWYAPGVGLVRAEGANERLTLVQWVVP